jgi:fibronectin type 3 domain-containing protein
MAAVLLAAVILCPPPAGAKAGRVRVAVLSLHPENIEAVGDDAEVLYSLISALERAGEGYLEIMPRRELEERLNQAGLSQGRDRKSALAAGRALSVQYVVYGEVEKRGSAVAARIRLLNVASKRDAAAWRPVFDGYRAIRPGCAEVAKEAVAAMKTDPSPEALAGSVQPRVKISKFRAESVGDVVRLTWTFDRTDPVTGFVVYRSSSRDGPFQQLGETRKNVFEDDAARPGSTYFYRLEAKLRSGRPARADQLAQVKNVGEKFPAPPLVLDAVPGVRRTRITFAPALANAQNDFDIEAYRLHRRRKGETGFSPLDSADISHSKNELAWVVVDEDGLQDGETYEYVLTSVEEEGKESAYSDVMAATMPDRPRLQVRQDGLLRKVVLGWKPVEGVKGYYLYRRPKGGEFERAASIPSGVNEYADVSDLGDGQTYEYALTGFDEQGETGRSKVAAARTKPKPPAPEEVEAASGMVKAVKLTWRPIQDEHVGGYYVYRGLGPDLERIDTVAGHASGEYLDQGNPPFDQLEDGTTYFYAVSAFNTHKAEGERSRTVTARTKPRPRPVRGFRVEALGPERIRISWEKNPEEDIEAYVISHYRIKGIWTPAATAKPSQDSVVETGMSPGVEYMYRIIVRDRDGLESDPVEAGPVTTPEQ